MIRRAELIAFLVSAGTAGGLLVLLLFALRSAGPPDHVAEPHKSAVYRPSPVTQTTAPPDAGPEVEILAGMLAEDDERTVALEAAMRLHLWLALRDVVPTGPLLRWTPARRDRPSLDPVDVACLPDTLPPARTLGRNDPPLLGRSLRPRQRIRAFLRVSSEVGVSRFEAHVCTPGSRGMSQVFVADAGREGPALREVMAWLTGVLKLPDTESWFNAWSRPIAPDVGALRAYGMALAESMGPARPPPEGLLQAAALLPEAAWAAGELSVDPLYRRRLFQRAAALQPGFTAAVEDLAWEWSRAARPDLAMLTLSRIQSPERTRPSELLLAARMLEAGAAADAAQILAQLPAPWTSTTAARRLEARAKLQIGDAEGARNAARAWSDADPSQAEAWLVRGQAEQLLDERQAASAAYERALDQPSRLRPVVLERWAILQLKLGRPGAVVELLRGDDDSALVWRRPELLALRAFASWQVDDSTRAAADTARLVELQPDRPEHRRNLCVFALAAGTTEGPPEECGLPVFDDLFGVLMEAVWLSRRPFRTPEEGGLLDQRVKEAVALAPISPAAAGAALRVLGPRASKEELAELQARWQLSRSTEPR